MIYLSDCQGGATEFLPSGVAIQPAPGLAAWFRHRVEHRGAPVRAGLKYVLRTDAIYEAPPLGLSD